MTFKEAWEVLQKAVEASHKVWAYFATISLAVAGYIVGWDKLNWSWKMYGVVAVAYALFAYGNRKVVLNAQRDVVAAAALVERVRDSLPPDAPERILTSKCVSEKSTYLFHLGCTLVVIAAIAVTWWDKCVDQKCPMEAKTSGPTVPTSTPTPASASAPSR